jgi:hypothetical protein
MVDGQLKELNAVGSLTVGHADGFTVIIIGKPSEGFENRPEMVQQH